MTEIKTLKSRNPNHPKKGSSIKVGPIRDLNSIQTIKDLLRDKPRDLCLFVVGINTAYRASELASIKVGQVHHLGVRDRLDLKQTKNSEYRAVTLNENAVEAIQAWLRIHPNPEPEAPLFPSLTTGEALRPKRLTALVKDWCLKAKLDGNYGSHSMRKTWGYHQRKTYGQPLSLLTRAFRHSSEAQTLDYLCIQPEEIEDLYAGVL